METPTLPKARPGVDTTPFIIPGSNIGVMSDEHVPYHDIQAIDTAVKSHKKAKIDCLLLNGDSADIYSLSRHDKEPFQDNCAIEIDAVKEYLTYLRYKFKKIPIIYKIGNHELRWQHYLKNKAPELSRLSQLAIPSILGLDDLGITLVENHTFMCAGDLTVYHGNEAIQGSGTKSPARKLYLNTNHHGICGHFHRTDSYRFKLPDEKVIECYTVGCLCDLSPRYLPSNKNNWNHGFARVEVHGREFKVHNHMIIDHRVVYA